MSIFACSINDNTEVFDENKKKQNIESATKDVDLKTLSEDISDMVDIKSTSSSGQTDKSLFNENKTRVTQGGNRFAQQKSEKMTGVPLVIIEDYKKAIAFMRHKDWQSAEKIFDNIISQQPQLSGSYVNKALIAKDRQQLPTAHDYLDKAISINELNPYAHHLKGQLLKLEGNFAKAEQSYLRALLIWPDYTEVHLSMAILLELYRGRLLESFSYYQSYLVLQPKDSQVERWLAGLKIKLKRAGLAPTPTIKLTNAEYGG